MTMANKKRRIPKAKSGPQKSTQPFAEIKALDALAKNEKMKGFRHVQDFLCRFGYLNEGDGTPDVLDGPTQKALKEFQRRHGRRPDGKFTTATRDEMAQSRCAMPCLPPISELDAMGFAPLTGLDGITIVPGCRWNMRKITYTITAFPQDVENSLVVQALENAFGTWSIVSGLTFSRVDPPIDPKNPPDIEIKWRQAEPEDGAEGQIDMSDGRVAHADLPLGCPREKKKTVPKPLHFNEDDHIWTVGEFLGQYDIESVAVHEIGHCLGLVGHSTDKQSVMSSEYTPDEPVKRDLTPNDIANIQRLYPPDSVVIASAAIQSRRALLQQAEALQRELEQMRSAEA